MGDLIAAIRQAAMLSMAAGLDVPAELMLSEIPALTPEERARLEAEDLAHVQEAYDEAARIIGPKVIESFGLDPAKYELKWEMGE